LSFEMQGIAFFLRINVSLALWSVFDSAACQFAERTNAWGYRVRLGFRLSKYSILNK
jgi:hypothetical protein